MIFWIIAFRDHSGGKGGGVELHIKGCGKLNLPGGIIHTTTTGCESLVFSLVL